MSKDLQWYMITTISGKEEKVIESLKNRVVSENVSENFDVENGFKVMLVPHIAPKELEKKNAGEDYKVKTKNLFKGYIFVKMNMTNSAWYVVRNTQYVTGLVGSSGQGAKPTPVSGLEIKKMEKRVAKINEDFNSGKTEAPFAVGDLVEVTEGPAKGQVGSVMELNTNDQSAVIELILFERKTPTKIPFGNLSKKK